MIMIKRFLRLSDFFSNFSPEEDEQKNAAKQIYRPTVTQLDQQRNSRNSQVYRKRMKKRNIVPEKVRFTSQSVDLAEYLRTLLFYQCNTKYNSQLQGHSLLSLLAEPLSESK